MAKKILIIDDEKDAVSGVAMRLEATGYQVIGAYNGPDGLKLAMEQKPRLILLDLMMPGMDGFEVLRKLKANDQTRNIPVIIFSCKGESDAIFKTQDLGSVDYIIKPFESQELLDLVKRHIL
ncbi:MAG: response regulator [Candidatus Omnitrophica bacterium]|nr:response regulator [Candidatus Omnitrophota bacterium]